MQTDTIPQLVSHRGDMVQYPENSWPALQAAVDAGACWLEFDIQMCADGNFVLLHDSDFRRTGNDPGRIFELDTASCRRISVHYPEKFGQRFSPAPPPLLNEVLQWLADYPDVRAMVEIKSESLEHFGHEQVMHPLLDILGPRHEQCVLISFDEKALRAAQQHTALETGWVLRACNEAHRKRAQQLNPQYLICNDRKIPAQEIPWPGSWHWMLYDMMDPDKILRRARQGFELIETGDITRLLKHPLLARRACHHGL